MGVGRQIARASGHFPGGAMAGQALALRDKI